LGLPGVCGEDVESRSTMGLAADWSIGKDQRRSRFDQRANVLQKGWINGDTLFQLLQVWRFFADTGGIDPVAAAAGIDGRIHRVKLGAG
jgi:hypothetical protein